MNVQYSDSFSSILKNMDFHCENAVYLLGRFLGKEDLFAFEILFREMLTNAVIHGNKRDSSKNVYFLCEIEDDHFNIVIRDQGSGFDWRSKVNTPLETEGKTTSGRGIPILSRYATSYKYNNKGNEISLTRKLAQA